MSFDSKIRQVQAIYDENGIPISSAPYKPSLMFPFGTDALGYDIGMKILEGAKFTLLSVLGISFLRIICSFVLSIPLAFFVPDRIRRILDQFLSSFYFIPLTIIAVFLLTPVLWEQLRMPGWEEYFIYSFNQRIWLEVLILTILVIPLLGSTIGNILASILKEDFIESARILGSSKWRIFSKHVIPHLLPKLVIVWCQQCVQLLIIFMHLGYFKLFFGGTDVDYNPDVPDPPVSLSNKWSGLIGDYYNLITVNPSIALGPIIMFGIAIYAFQLIGEGFQHHLQTRHHKKVKDNRVSGKQKFVSESRSPFNFLHKRGA